MSFSVKTAVTVVVFLLASLNAFSQSVPSSLFACLDGNGNLYGVTPTGKLGEGCSSGDLPVSIGSAGAVSASNGLVGQITNGVLDIGLAPGLAIPPSCPPGQIPISDGQGAWICTLPNLTGNPNPAAKVWVVPKYGINLAPQPYADIVHFVNPGAQDGRVICYTMTALGGYISSLTEEHTLSRGSKGKCDAWVDEAGTGGYGLGDPESTWLVIVSDVPILPSALWRAKRNENNGQIQAFPVDCRYPEGYEAACDLAIE